MTDDRDHPGADLDAATQVDTSAGRLPDLGSKFEVLARIGAGSMGSVYKVRHRELDHVRAVKVVTGTSDEQAVSRLRQEAAIATELAHPNIVTVYDLERLPGGGLGIVMEFLEGEDLAALVRRRGRIPVDELVQRFDGVADALDRMHDKGVIHRDLKPANLFLCDDGTVKVLDFGISRHLVQDDALTETGNTPGTPAFMAPEQFEGADLSPRTDVYGLGAVLYMAVTGKMPITGKLPAEVVAGAMFRVPPRADALCEDVPPYVADALARALEKKPEKRPATASSLVAAVAGELELPSAPPTQDEPIAHPPRQARRPGRLLLLALAAVLLGVYALMQVVAPVAPPTEGSPTEGPTAAAEEPVRGGVLRVGATTALPTLDPLYSDVSEGQMALCRLMYDTLVTLDWTGEVQPLLATSWTVADGKRTFTFALRGDVRFHDDPCFDGGVGRLLTSRDVKTSLERVYGHIHTYEGHPLADSPRVVGTDALIAGEADHLVGIETPDDHTVVVRFERPATEFLHTLSWLPWSITPGEALEAYAANGDLRRNVVGTGPYRVSDGEQGGDLTLLPHPAAWQRDTEGRSLPFPDRIEVHVYKGPIAAGTSLKEGRIDLLMGAPDTLRDEFFDVGNGKARPRAGWEGYRAGGYLDDAMREQRVMLFDTRSENPLLADVRIRRAVGLALRRDELTPEDGFPTDSALVDSMLGYKPRTHADPEQARALLAEAGFDGSEDGPELTLCGTASFHDNMRSIQTSLEAVGFPAAVVPADPRAMHEYMTEGGCDALMLAMVGLVVDDDPLEYMISYGSMVQLDQRVEDFPAFIDRARGEGDPGRRAELSLELARILEDDAMILILAERRPGIPDYAFIATDRVGGLTDPRTGLMNPLRERLHQLWLRPTEP